MDPRSSRTPPVTRTEQSTLSQPLPELIRPQEGELSEHLQLEGALEDDDIPYPEPSSEQMLLPPPNFRPFFTLIDDTTSGEQYHPYVHYIFADDDPVLVTAASMRGLGLDDAKYLPQEAIEHEEQRSREEEDGDEPRDLPLESPLPPPIPGVKDHFLVIDVAADGRTVVDAQSLSSEWQIINTDTRTAPSFDESSPDQGYLLRIQGVEISSRTKGKGKSQAGQDRLSLAREQNQGDIFEALDGLVQGIEGSLELAGKISSTGVRTLDESVPIDNLQEQGR